MSESEGDGNFLRITNRDIYTTLTSLEAKVSQLLSQKEKVEDHEGRIRALEGRFVSVMVGAVAVVLGAAVTLVVRVVIH